MNNEITVERIKKTKPKFDALKSMYVERGTKEDWLALEALHYKKDGALTGSRVYRCVTDNGDLVGVIVFSTVGLLLKPRHKMFPNLRPDKDTFLTNSHRARWLNANVSRASRIVNDTLYRGVGVGYRMTNLAMRMENKMYVEIQSSMSKFNPFDIKAGFVHGKIERPRAYDQGLKLFRSWFTSHPADQYSLMEEFNAMPPGIQKRAEAALREFYSKHSAKEKTGGNRRYAIPRWETLPVLQIIKELQQLVFATPVYGVWRSPDFQRTIVPERLPLSAFDLQLPTEPLRTDLL